MSTTVPAETTKTTSGNKRRTWLRMLIALLGGVCMAFAFPPYDIGNIVWVGLIPLLCVLWLGRVGFWRGFGYGWLYGMGWYCVSFWWIHEVGITFNIPTPIFIAIAFAPLMSIYALLPALWAGMANTLLRPKLAAAPTIAGDMGPEKRRQIWSAWEWADLVSTLRSALGCGALWVCIEWLRANGTLGFSWNSLGMALYNGLSFAQWAEFVGTAALSFIPAFTAVILWCAARRTWKMFRGIGRGCRPWDFYGTAIILFALFLGGMYMSKAYAPTVMMRRDSTLQLPVVAVQLNLDQRERIEEGNFHPEYYGMLLRNTAAAYTQIQKDTVKRAMQNSEVGLIQQLPVWVIWPESAFGSPLYRDTQSNTLLPDKYTAGLFFHDKGLPGMRKVVRDMGGQNPVIFTGADELLCVTDGDYITARGMHNSLTVIPDGFDSIQTHPKQHLIPFGEYVPLTQEIEWIGDAYSSITGTQVGDGIRPGSGDQPLTVPVPGTNEQVGVIPAVCYEDTVGNLLTKYVRKGPQVIVNVSNDAWFRHSVCGEQQARNAAFRCIELRRPMVRAANMGVTCSIAPNGAFIDSLKKADGSPHLAGFSYAVLPVDRNAGFTLYALLGDWAVGVCALLVIVCSVIGIRKHTRQS